MYLTLGTALNFLENLNANVKGQLQELWIVTPVYFVEDDEKRLENVVKQFHGLTKLHLILPNHYFNSEELFPHCQNITELSILTEAPDEPVKITFQHIKKNCKGLQILNTYRYDDAVPMEVMRLAMDLFPNAAIKSIHMDSYAIIENTVIVNSELFNPVSCERDKKTISM